MQAQFAQMVEKEKSLRALENQLKERGSKVEMLEKAMSRANDDPYGLLESLNLDLDRLYEVKKSGGQFAPGEMKVRALQSEVEKLKSQIAERERAAQEAAQRREAEQALANFRNNVSQVLQQSDTHEIARAYGAVDDVMDVISRHFQETSEMLPLDEALNRVEQTYEERVKKLAGVKKARSLLGVDVESPSALFASQNAPQGTGGGSPVRTLTNSMTSSTAPASEGLTEKQRWARALALLEGASI
jgi:hypothetical protein